MASTIRPIDMKNFDGEVERVWERLQSGMGEELGLRADDQGGIRLQGKDMKMILKPELVLIGEKERPAVGFALALPDVNVALKPAGGHLFPLGTSKSCIINVWSKVYGYSHWEWWRSSGRRVWRRLFTPRWFATHASWASAKPRCPGFWRTTF